MKRILFAESAAGMGGVQVSTLNLVQHLDRALWEPIVALPREGPLLRLCRDARVETHLLHIPPSLSTSLRLGERRRLPNPLAWGWGAGLALLAAHRLRSLMRLRKPDLVVTKGLLRHFYGGLAARGARLPCLWHLQDLICECLGGIYAFTLGLAARWLADVIVVDGAAICRQLPPDLRERTMLIANGVDIELCRRRMAGLKMRSDLGIPPQALVIAHAARMTLWKGQHHLLEAFLKLATKMRQTYLLFVGSALFENSSFEKRLREEACKSDFAQRIIFAGYRSDLPAVLSAADVFAYPSLEKDTSPLALTTAMACGLPIVAYDIDGVREVLGDGESGRLVAVGQIGELANALIQMLQKADARRIYGRRAEARARELFSMQTFVSHFGEGMTKALAAQARPRPAPQKARPAAGGMDEARLA